MCMIEAVVHFLGLEPWVYPKPTLPESQVFVPGRPTFVPGFSLAMCPYTEIELIQVFERVCNAVHWATSISCVVNAYQKDKLVWAIRAFHGVEPTVTPHAGTTQFFDVFSPGKR